MYIYIYIYMYIYICIVKYSIVYHITSYMVEVMMITV